MRLRQTRHATDQLDRVLGDLASRSPSGAASVSGRLAEVTTMLPRFTKIGRQTARRGVRRITIVPYPYNIDDRVGRQEIVILGIRHANRKPLP